MKKTGIFYGSSTGHTAADASLIAKKLGVDPADVHDVASTGPVKVADYDVLVLGTSTWGSGDLQDDWYDFVAGLAAMDLAGKKIALFGTGDETMSDTFCDGVADLYDKIRDTGAEFIGEFTTEGYDFVKSRAVRDDGMAIGLLLDDVNHPDLTEPRVSSWAAFIKAAF